MVCKIRAHLKFRLRLATSTNEDKLLCSPTLTHTDTHTDTHRHTHTDTHTHTHRNTHTETHTHTQPKAE